MRPERIKKKKRSQPREGVKEQYLRISGRGVGICLGHRIAELIISQEPVLVKYREVGIRLKDSE